MESFLKDTPDTMYRESSYPPASTEDNEYNAVLQLDALDTESFEMNKLEISFVFRDHRNQNDQSNNCYLFTIFNDINQSLTEMKHKLPYPVDYYYLRVNNRIAAKNTNDVNTLISVKQYWNCVFSDIPIVRLFLQTDGLHKNVLLETELIYWRRENYTEDNNRNDTNNSQTNQLSAPPATALTLPETNTVNRNSNTDRAGYSYNGVTAEEYIREKQQYEVEHNPKRPSQYDYETYRAAWMSHLTRETQTKRNEISVFNTAKKETEKWKVLLKDSLKKDLDALRKEKGNNLILMEQCDSHHYNQETYNQLLLLQQISTEKEDKILRELEVKLQNVSQQTDNTMFERINESHQGTDASLSPSISYQESQPAVATRKPRKKKHAVAEDTPNSNNNSISLSDREEIQSFVKGLKKHLSKPEAKTNHETIPTDEEGTYHNDKYRNERIRLLNEVRQLRMKMEKHHVQKNNHNTMLSHNNNSNTSSYLNYSSGRRESLSAPGGAPPSQSLHL
ncbi:homeodomain containing protein [Angomonas deanei]|uniref:Uncharacterized protein n=1 Tax=Angomonas deanei TaxID=59799 RepID=A0A7G2CPB3_9TRYP|nr:homeodomain containing protein [Angomonas deanei]CAD2221630.1 hypothetical protein, conserved [Angomonas deanei]|eukprot:EPY15432.1 homeodomain containing protein [Angomonas deanei]